MDPSAFVCVPADILHSPLSQAGGKASALARLIDAGIRVPRFFVVTSAAFAAHLSRNGIEWPGPPEPLREQILRAPLPSEVGDAVSKAMAGFAKVAVRSSGADEDSASSSFAGQFASFLSVDPGAVLDTIKQCWASFLSDRSISYRQNKGIELGDTPGFAVVIQEQIFPRAAGVVFTIHPLDPDGETAYLEANFGTGESVVGSLATPDGKTISRTSGRVVETYIGTKRRMTVVSPDSAGSTLVEIEPSLQRQPVLTDAEAEEVFQVGRQIEQLEGCPQDIEWAIDTQGLWILQARPITGGGRV